MPVPSCPSQAVMTEIMDLMRQPLPDDRGKPLPMDDPNTKRTIAENISKSDQLRKQKAQLMDETRAMHASMQVLLGDLEARQRALDEGSARQESSSAREAWKAGSATRTRQRQRPAR